jgi:diamine N-acetyltransferase
MANKGARRRVTPDSVVSLREVTAETLSRVLELCVREDQHEFVASNAKSIAEAHFHPEAWYRAIYADETLVGFVMLHDENLRDAPRRKDFYFLWRLMIDARFQGMSFGRRAMSLLIEHVRSRPNAKELFTSCRGGQGSPEGFYLRLGFERTGQEVDGEIELRLAL